MSKTFIYHTPVNEPPYVQQKPDRDRPEYSSWFGTRPFYEKALKQYESYLASLLKYPVELNVPGGSEVTFYERGEGNPVKGKRYAVLFSLGDEESTVALGIDTYYPKYYKVDFGWFDADVIEPAIPLNPSGEKKEEPKCTLSNDDLIAKAEQWVSDLCKSGGNAWTLRVPVDFCHDPDIIFLELCKRLKASKEVGKVEDVKWQLCPKCNGDGDLLRYNTPHAITTSVDFTCDVCKGNKIIQTPFAASPVSDRDDRLLNLLRKETGQGKELCAQALSELEKEYLTYCKDWINRYGSKF